MYVNGFGHMTKMATMPPCLYMENNLFPSAEPDIDLLNANVKCFLMHFNGKI